MFEALIATFFGTAGKAVAGKAANASLEAVVEGVRKQLGDQEASEAQKAVAKAVEAARQEIRDRYFGGEDELSRDVVKLLDHPPLARDVVRILLVRGQPDFEALREHYLGQAGDEESAGERWERMKVPLDSFIASLERHLQADPHFGPLLQDLQQLARLGGIEEMSRQIAETSERVAVAVEAGVDLQTEQSLRLGEIVGWLEKIAAGLDAEKKARPRAGRRAAGEESYLRLLRAECDRLPLAEDPRGSGETKPQKRASLARVYVDLETTDRPHLEQVFDRLGVPKKERRKLARQLEGRAKSRGAAGEAQGEAIWEQLELLRGRDAEKHPLKPWLPEGMSLELAFRPVTALEALARHRRLVLLGNAGSGKSTLVNHLAATLAGALTGDEPRWGEVLEGRFEKPLFPVRVVLRRWSAGLEPGEEVSLDRVHQALADQADGLDRERLEELLEDRHTLVLFDGLDEVPAGSGGGEALDRRRWVVQAIEKFLTAHKDCWVLVTSRIKPYRDGDYRLGDLPALELAPLDDARIERFSHLWYEEQKRIGGLPPRVDPAERRRRMLEAIRDREVLGDMARTPLLLTMLARVNARSVLPEGRAELYDSCIEQLLWEWEREKAEEGKTNSLVALLEEPKPPLQRSDVERVLWELTCKAHGETGKATVTLPASELREALAKVHPGADESKGWAWAAKVLKLMEQRSGLLVSDGAGALTFPHRSFQEYLAARWLLEEGDAASKMRALSEDDTWREVVLLACGYLGWQGSYTLACGILAELVAGGEPADPAGWRRVGLAGQAWREFGPHRARGEVGRDLAEKIPALLIRLMQHPGLPPTQRLEAGLLLADLGVLPEDLDAWVEIPADMLDYSFKIGKYPVTNAQYSRFVDAGGYEEEKSWWSKEARREIRQWDHGEWPDCPHFWGDRSQDCVTQPVVGVSWYEAVAYCTWLTERLRLTGEISGKEEVRLATETEWVRAACGVDGTKYPWGEEFEAWRVNSKEAGLGQPTPVAMHLGGASREGVFDLAGNVWEWTADKDEDGWPFLRGGAFWNGAGSVGADASHEEGPWLRAAEGFRCVVVHTTREPEVPAGNGQSRPAPPPRRRHERWRGPVLEAGKALSPRDESSG